MMALLNAAGEEVNPSAELSPEEFADYCDRYGIPWGQR